MDRSDHNILCLSGEGTARWRSSSRLFLQYFLSKKLRYINRIADCPQELPDYTFTGLGQGGKVQIARYCVCTRYPHYVPLTLNCVTLFRRAPSAKRAPTQRYPRAAKGATNRANFPGACIARVEMQLKRPNFRHHAREFRFTGNFAKQFLAIYLGVFEHDRRTL